MPTDVETLMEMGFSKNRAEKALAKTQYKGVQLAMDWLFSHNEDPDIDDLFQVPEGQKLGEASESAGDTAPDASGSASGDTQSEETPSATAQVRSLKCDECGKKLRTPDDIQVHAARTGHQSFSESTEEIKPLTEEERKVQMARLQEKLKQRQDEKKEQEKREVLEKEKMRRKQGREMGQAKQQMELDEAKRLVALKKKEKEDEKRARQRVKDQIARDRADRAAREARTQPQAGDTALPPPPQATPTAVTAAAAPPKKEYDTTRLQIRLSNGSTLTQSFKAMEPLAAVRVYIEVNRTDGQVGAFSLMTPFPRKVFTTEDMEKPLKELGLVPSANLTVTRPQ